MDPSPQELFQAFMRAGTTPAQVAAMTVDELTQTVAQRRKSKVPAEMRELPMSDRSIAEVILAYSRRGRTGGEPVSQEADAGNALRLIAEQQRQLLAQAEQQTRHLRSISTAATVWLLLVILGLIAGCIMAVMGGSLLPSL